MVILPILPILQVPIIRIFNNLIHINDLICSTHERSPTTSSKSLSNNISCNFFKTLLTIFSTYFVLDFQ